MVKRVICITAAVSLLLAAALGRVGYITLSGDYTVSSGYNSYTLTVYNQKQTIYDRNMRKMNNNENVLAAVIRPNENCLSELSLLFEQSEIEDIVDELSQGYPIVRQIDTYADCRYIQIYEIKENETSAFLKFIQKQYGETAYSMSINFSVDALGRLLDGDEGEVIEEYNTDIPQGVVLTVDSEIQSAVEEAAQYMRKGAVVVMDAQTSQVLAMYSAPDDNMFRPVMPYTVGSVFKLVVSACAIENDIDIDFKCEGQITVGDTDFSCQNGKAHGQETVKSALANSCNCYFVKLALTLGAERLHETALTLGFGDNTEIMPKYIVSDGNLPSESELKQSKGQLALLGFGQGLLTATPLQFCTALCTLSGSGIYTEPLLVSATVDNNDSVQNLPYNTSKRVLREETCKTLREYMRYVVTNGTGSAADYNDLSGGKTSTAQSGIYINGREVLNTWFAGIYPYNDPKYCIVIMTEDGTSGARDCCPIFRTIVENIS